MKRSMLFMSLLTCALTLAGCNKNSGGSGGGANSCANLQSDYNAFWAKVEKAQSEEEATQLLEKFCKTSKVKYAGQTCSLASPDGTTDEIVVDEVECPNEDQPAPQPPVSRSPAATPNTCDSLQKDYNDLAGVISKVEDQGQVIALIQQFCEYSKTKYAGKTCELKLIDGSTENVVVDEMECSDEQPAPTTPMNQPPACQNMQKDFDDMVEKAKTLTNETQIERLVIRTCLKMKRDYQGLTCELQYPDSTGQIQSNTIVVDSMDCAPKGSLSHFSL